MLVLSSAVAAQPTRPILFLGDSISAAYGLSLEQGWVALLESRLENEDRPYHTVNASISGDTSAGGLRRLPALLETHEPRIVIIELGGNDGLRGYPVGQLKDNLITMIELSEAAGASALVLPMEIPPNLGKFYTDAFRATFTQAAEHTGIQVKPALVSFSCRTNYLTHETCRIRHHVSTWFRADFGLFTQTIKGCRDNLSDVLN